MGRLNLLVMVLRLTSLLAKFGLTLFITRFLGLEALGFYGMIAGATIVLPVFIGLGINYTLPRHAIIATSESLSRQLGSFCVLVLGGYLLLSVPTLWMAHHYEIIPLVSVLIPVLLLDHLHTDGYQLLLNLSRPLFANLLLLCRSALWMIAYMMAAWWNPDWRQLETLLLFWLVGLLIASVALGFALKAWPWAWGASVNQFIPWLREQIAHSRALYFNSLAETAANYLDRYVISLFLSVELAGIYFFFWSIYSAAHNLLFTGVVQFSRPKIVMAMRAREDYQPIFKSCWRQTFAMAIVIGFASIVTLYFILPWLDRPAMLNWFPLLGLIQLTMVISILREAQKLVFYGAHRDDLLLRATLISSACAVVLQFTLIPWWGLWGAGVAFLLANGINYGIQRRLLHRVTML